jgi:membrane protein implicated in regulation of membrane protease activity
MTDQDSRFASYARTYRPWGQVRRQNLIGRVVHGMLMTALGLGALAALALLFVFAASVAVAGVVALVLMAVAAFIRRTPARIFVRSDEPNGKGMYEARKKGSTWIVY